MTGSTFGRYEIRGELGRGGMATVYHAFDPHVQRHVALKILPRVFMHEEHFRERFIREARAVAALEHWAIVPLHDYGEEDEQPFFVMRYMTGGSLLDRIQQGRLTLEEITPTIERIAAALDFAHRRDVIHRDVKPANILFDVEGDAYLSDFGIVKLAEATAHLTGSGIVGTPTYMAPEMVYRGGVTPLIDVYALGVTLFQALAGEPPYEADTPMGTALAHTTQPIPQIGDWNPDLPAGIQAVIEGALAKDPADRYQSAGALAADLRGIAFQERAHPAARPAPATTHVQPPVEPTIEEPLLPPVEPTLGEPLAAAPTIEEPMSSRSTRMPASTPTPPAPAASAAAPAVKPAARPARRGFPIWLVGVLGLAGLAVVVGLALAFWPRGDGAAQAPGTEEPVVEVPVEESQQPAPTTVAEQPVQVLPNDPWGVIVVWPDQPVRIAVNTATSGSVQYIGVTELNAAMIARDDAGGQVLGHDIELVANDSPCSAEGGQAIASQIVSDPSIVAVVGHTCSTSCMAAAEVYEGAHFTMVSPSCTAGNLADPNAPRAFMRTASNDSTQGAAAAEYAYNTLGARRVATIHDRSPYAAGLVEVFVDRFVALGGEVIDQEVFDQGETNLRPLLNAMAAQGPDMLYFPLFSDEGGLVAAQSAEIDGLRNVIRMGADGIRNDEFLAAAGGGAEGVYASGPAAVEGPGYAEFIQTYVERFGGEPTSPFGPESYDALNLILQAIKAVAVVGDDGTLYIGRQALREAMHASSFEGLSGRINCNDVGDCSTAPVEFAQVRGGVYVVVGTQ